MMEDPASVLDALARARARLSRPDFRSPRLNLKVTVRTLKLPSDSVLTPGERWDTSHADKHVTHAFRHMGSDQTIAVYDTLISYKPTPTESPRQAPLFITEAGWDETDARLTAKGPRRRNRLLWDYLASLGVSITEEQDGVRVEGDAELTDIPGAVALAQIASPGAATMVDLLDPDLNPALLDHRLVRSLIGDAGVSEQPASSSVGDADRGDGHAGPSPHGSMPPLPLDPDQAAAVTAIVAGSDLVIHGPPGCGKSQVIAAAVVALHRLDRRALVVSTEAAALGSVERRIAQAMGGGGTTAVIGTPEAIAAMDLPSDPPFDVLIIDEGSRMSVDLALTLAWRTGQIVVIGDDAQMRPASDVASVLHRALEAGLRQVALRFHYRSRNRNLISISNVLAYGMQLRTAPRPEINPIDGLQLTTFDRATIRSTPAGLENVSEADAIVARLMRHGKDRDPRTVGVIAMNTAQAALISSKLAERAKAGEVDPDRLGSGHEPLFVRTTGGVQGEERDLILVSMTFARQGGRPIDNFGIFEHAYPLERLNVCMSRARDEMELFLSFRPSDIAADRPLGAGAITMLAMRKMVDVLVHSDLRLATPLQLLQVGSRIGMHVDHLGIVYGFRARDEAQYRCGLVVRDGNRAEEHWDMIVLQLKAVGWTVCETTADELRLRPINLAQEIRHRSRM